MVVNVHFFSYFKDLTGCERTTIDLADGTTLGQGVEQVCATFQKLAAMRRSMLIAVGVDYQDSAYLLKTGDEISLFPPVQGG